MKPALIDLDEIKTIRYTFESYVLGEKDISCASVLKMIEELNVSQPALVELLRKAVEYGVIYGTKNADSNYVNLSEAFRQFLTQNNLNDETT